MLSLKTPDGRISFRQTKIGYVVQDSESGAKKTLSGRDLFYGSGGNREIMPGTVEFNARARQEFDGSVDTDELIACYLE